MSVGCVEPGIGRLFQNAAGENPQNSVRAREIRRNNRVRLTLAARRLLLVMVMVKNSVYASYTYEVKAYCRSRSGFVSEHQCIDATIDWLNLDQLEPICLLHRSLHKSAHCPELFACSTQPFEQVQLSD